MVQDDHETLELFRGLITRARAKKVNERVDGKNEDLVVLVDKVMKERLKLNFEPLEDGQKPPKVCMLHPISIRSIKWSKLEMKTCVKKAKKQKAADGCRSLSRSRPWSFSARDAK